MTAIATPATDDAPEWEKYARQGGTLPPPDATNASDPDYLVAQLRYAREEAAGYGAEFRAKPEEARFAATAELAYLRTSVDRLIKDLRPLGRAGTEMLEVLRALHPHLNWRACAGGLFGTEEYTAEAKGAAERAAKHLRLTPCPESDLGPRWHGQIETWDVEVWGRA
jgi:hypothetical protein